MFMIPFPVSIVSSTRIANLIGAGLVDAARLSAKVVSLSVTLDLQDKTNAVANLLLGILGRADDWCVQPHLAFKSPLQTPPPAAYLSLGP